jgi:hypothetical protein
MPDDTIIAYVQWLRARRAQVYGAALELVNRANAEHRQLTPAEHGHCQRLIAALDGLDARLRRAGTDARRASDTEPNVWDWARANDASYGAAPDSGDRATLA